MHRCRVKSGGTLIALITGGAGYIGRFCVRKLLGAELRVERGLGWRARRILDDVVRSAWLWQQRLGRHGDAQRRDV